MGNEMLRRPDTKSHFLDKGIEVIEATSAVHVRSDQVLCYNWSPGFMMGT